PAAIKYLAGRDGEGVRLGIFFDRRHEVVFDPDAVVGVLEEDRAVRRAVERRVIAAFDQRPGLALLIDLAVDELDDVRMVGVEDDHLGRTPRLAARLDHAGEVVDALPEGDRAGCSAASRKQFARGAKRRGVRAGPRTVRAE